MTILVQYAPEKYTDGIDLPFTFENLGTANVEVWAEVIISQDPPVYVRKQLRPQEFTLILVAQGPTYKGGIVRLTGQIPAGFQISIERNTLMSQTSILPATGTFDMDTLEFMVDKLTMIIQEIAQRKCLSDVINAGITQEIEFNPYRVLYKTSVDHVLDTVTAYCLAMDQSIYGGDCSDNPGGV
jgi:hypothetical protein